MAVMGVGIYVPWGDYKAREDSAKMSVEYSLWYSMFVRCYTKTQRNIFMSYSGCSVAEEWHRSDNFWMWCEKQIGFKNEGYHLDKDILITGNKVYCPERCVFVPQELNKFFSGENKTNGQLPRGVYWDKKAGKFRVALKSGSLQQHLGYFASAEEASSAYKEARNLATKHWIERLKKRDFEVDERIILKMENCKF